MFFLLLGKAKERRPFGTYLCFAQNWDKGRAEARPFCFG